VRYSTGKPTKEEEARIIASKEGPCVCCFIQLHRGLIDEQDVSYQNDYHHVTSGGRRLGHMSGMGLCKYHHVGHPIPGYSKGQARDLFGPSLMDGSRTFRDYFMDNQTLIDLQTKIIECKHA
jgi:hypothetical protein